MSGCVFLGWIDPDGQHRRSAVALEIAIVQQIVEQMKQSHPATLARVVPIEEIDTWMAQ